MQFFSSYDGMNMDVIDDGGYVRKSENALSAMLVTSAVRHTLERVWSPDTQRAFSTICDRIFNECAYDAMSFSLLAYPPTEVVPLFGPLQ